MKYILAVGIFAIGMMTAGCVRRTVSIQPAMNNPKSRNEYSGSNKVVEEKIIWFWQDEFRHPQQ